MFYFSTIRQVERQDRDELDVLTVQTAANVHLSGPEAAGEQPWAVLAVLTDEDLVAIATVSEDCSVDGSLLPVFEEIASSCATVDHTAAAALFRSDGYGENGGGYVMAATDLEGRAGLSISPDSRQVNWSGARLWQNLGDFTDADRQFVGLFQQCVGVPAEVRADAELTAKTAA